MAETKIGWLHYQRPNGSVAPGYTFNPWRGCRKVSPGCKHCYAEGWAKRTGQGHIWGPGADRAIGTDSYWRQPLRWDADARAHREPRLVFASSLADVFDPHPVAVNARPRLWSLIAQTGSLHWLLLSKRPYLAGQCLPDPWTERLPDRVWLGTSAESLDWAALRLPFLLAQPARTVFVSAEPLLAPFDLTALPRLSSDRVVTMLRAELDEPQARQVAAAYQSTWLLLSRRYPAAVRELPDAPAQSVLNALACRPAGNVWVILGGESGPGARFCDPAWLSAMLAAIRPWNQPVFVKQLGANIGPALPKIGKRDDPAHWPPDLRMQDHPAILAESLHAFQACPPVLSLS